MGEQPSQKPCENVVKVAPKLQVGQEFDSINQAYYFYNDLYAKVVGFSVRIGSSKKNKESGETNWKQFVCSKQGLKEETGERAKKTTSSTIEERNCGIKRTNYKARLSIALKQSSKKWFVSDFEETHNHPLTTPKRVHLLPSHRKITKAKKCLIETLNSSNVRTSQQFRIMESMAGGIQNVGCIPRDLRNYERDLRAGAKGHDATMFIEYFQSEQEKNPSFYFSYEKDDEGRLTRCFWADTTSQRAYNFFNDVLVFDSTYNTNKYKMIFAPFAGVNHHGQTIVFGFGLLSNEKTESYIWLFEQWLKAMPSGPPKVIITDQDQAITNAIAQVFPLAFHRYCIWHIMFKFREKLGLIYAKDYLQLFRASVYNSETVEEFEASWKSVVQQGKLEDHPWLNTMYGLRYKWVPAFCDHIFQAGMQSSQRAESNHAFFKTFVSHENTLLDFATRIERGIRAQRHKELESDHLDLNEVPKTKTYYPVEKQMREVYTKYIFLSFQDQVVKSTAYLRCDTLREDENECVYTVIRAAADEQSWKRRQILYDKTSGFAKCSCRFFEHEGIACRHIIFFFRSVNIVHMPNAYIMDRWTKSAKAGRVWDGDGVELKDDVDKSLIMRHVQLSQLSQDIIDMASLSSETTEYCREELCVLRMGIKERLTSLGVEEGVDELLSTRKRQPQQILIKEPSLVNAKGGSKRMKSAKELAMASQRKCSACNQVGHNKATCQNAGVHNAVVEPLVVEDENFQNAGVQDTCV